MDYVKEVIRVNGKPVRVVVRWGNKTNTYEKGEKGIKRLESRSIAPNKGIRWEMENQVWGIFNLSKNKKSKPITISSRNMLPKTRGRVEKLKEVRAEITLDGRLMITDSRKKVYFFPSIAKAISSQEKIVLDLGREQEELKVCLSTICGALNMLTGNNKDPDAVDFNALFKIFEQLEYCTEDFKARAADKMSEVFTLVDSLDRKNPSALAAKLWPIRDLVRSRFNRLPSIIRFANKRRQVLISEQQEMLEHMKTTLQVVEHLQEHYSSFFQDIAVFDKKLDEAVSLLKSVWLEPYFREAKVCLKYFKNLRLACSVGQKKGILDCVSDILKMFCESETKDQVKKELTRINVFNLTDAFDGINIKQLSSQEAKMTYDIASSVLPEACIYRESNLVQSNKLCGITKRVIDFKSVETIDICKECQLYIDCPIWAKG